MQNNSDCKIKDNSKFGDDFEFLEQFRDIDLLEKDLALLEECRRNKFIAHTDEGDIDVGERNLSILNGKLVIKKGIDGVCNWIDHLHFRISELKSEED